MQSKEKFRIILENTHEAIFILQDNVVKSANEKFEIITGYSRDELSRLHFSGLIHPDYRDLLVERHRKRVGGEDISELSAFKAKTKSGEEIWLEVNSVYIDWKGRPAVLCFARDVTRTKEMAAQLLQAQKMQAIGTLAGGIAHDLNNILSVIMGFTEISLSKADAESDMATRSGNVLQACHRGRDLIGKILTFARQEEQEHKPLKINLVISEAMKLLRASIPSTIEFIEKIDQNTGEIMACPTQIHQVIMNLCSNAAYAMKENGGRLEVSLMNYDIDDCSAAQYVHLKPGSYIRLVVTDTGTGMSPETMKRIFDPYFTRKKKGEGTGLGLSLVHGIVTSLGGSITVNSELGKGSIFQVLIPRIESAPEKMVPSGIECPRGSETILLVDDEELVLKMTAEMLTDLGYKVISHISSIAAYRIFRENPYRFDLLICDQTMPKMTGIELASKIHEIDEWLPIILCSGFSADINREIIHERGIRALLNKPILRIELAQKTRIFLNESLNTRVHKQRNEKIFMQNGY
ncbi:MAG: PAS domain S-box protein [Pseudomonadota bacterium]